MPKAEYSYSPRLPPVLRFDPSGTADELPPLLGKATREKLSEVEAWVLTEALRRHEPWLEWAGKREASSFTVDPVALHIHERVSTQAILRVAARQDANRSLFADPEQEYNEAVQSCRHDVDWSNRLILGDSLVVMSSLARREDLAGKVQMIYIDPPYGIKFASNFQPEIGETVVSDREKDLIREPEMVKAYRDTWTLGIHSYLAYLRDRIIVAKELLAEAGSLFALRKNLIRCDVESLEPLIIEPGREPVATFVRATVGYQEGSPSQASPFEFVPQDRAQYYRRTHLQTIQFQVAKLIVDQLVGDYQTGTDTRRRVLRLQSRHQLFPQVYRLVEEYVSRKVDFQNCHPCELGLEKYVKRMVERLRDGIVPDQEEGEPPLLPILNRYKPIGTTAEVDFKTTRPCHGTWKSHIDQVVVDTSSWEASAMCRLEASGAVAYYARNDHLELTIPYEYMGIDHAYEPDFLVRLRHGVTMVLEVKGFEDDMTKAKHNTAKRWVTAVNNWGQLGVWAFHVCRNPQLLDKEMEYLLQSYLSGAA